MTALREMFSAEDGRISTMRVLVAVVVLDVMALWNFAVVSSGQWIPLDLQTVAALACALGCKATQSAFELKVPPPPEVAK